MERAMADNGELQRGSNIGKGQVNAADYFLEPDIVTLEQQFGRQQCRRRDRRHLAGAAA